MNRRTALKNLAAVSSIPLAGCAAIRGSGQSGTVLGKITVVNSSLVPNRIRLLVVRGETDLLDRTLSLPAIDATNGTPGTVITPSWPEKQGQYTIHAHHVAESGERESTSWEYTFTQDDYDRYYGDRNEDPGCLGAVVTIGSFSESANAAIGISPTYMETPCGTSASR